MCNICYNDCNSEIEYFHCYSKKYSEIYSDNFLCCPGVYCTIESCIKCCDSNIEDYNNSQYCCNSPSEPCCYNCAIIFCPIAMITDIITFPFRCILYQCNKNNNKIIEATDDFYKK